MTDERMEQGTAYIGYEYRDIVVPRKLSSLCQDSYPCFGWEPDPHKTQSRDVFSSGKKEDNIRLYFRRRRDLCNKVELTRLQRNFDSCIEEIEKLKESEYRSAFLGAAITAFLGTVFMAGSTFAVTADPPVIWLMVLLAVPGFAGWILPYFFYKRIKKKKTEEIQPLIEEKYEEIYQICEKGNALLY